MAEYNRKHIAWLGAAQVGVILMGIPICGMIRSTGFIRFFCANGHWFLAVPVLWTALAVYFCEKEGSTPLRENLFYLSGFILAFWPGAYVFWILIAPLLEWITPNSGGEHVTPCVRGHP